MHVRRRAAIATRSRCLIGIVAQESALFPIVVVPFTPEVVDIGDLAVLLALVIVAFGVGWFLIRRRGR